MNEIFDKLILRIIFSIFIIAVIALYRYAHKFLYPTSKRQVFKNFYPSENSSDTVHLFARIIGICIIYSTLGFDENSGLFLSLFNFFVWGVSSFIIYLLSIYLIESISLYNFTYPDEILKRKNMSYAVISASIAICIAFIVEKIVLESEFSIVLLILFWLFSIVLFGLSLKIYPYVTILKFNSLLIQKNLALAFSYSGYLFGVTKMILTSFNQEHLDIKRYLGQVILSMILSAIIFPIFRFGLQFVFKIQQDLSIEDLKNAENTPEIGYGIYEGLIFYSAALLTSIIVGQIQFGIIYPFF